jgi:hypothetical protein
VNLVNLTASITVAVPTALQITRQQDGLLYMSNSIAGEEIDVFVVPGATSGDAVLQSAQDRYAATTHLSPNYGPTSDIRPAGSVTLIRARPFKVQFTSSLGPQFASGSMLALVRQDAAIGVVLTQLDIAPPNNGAALDLVVASLEQ